MGENGVVSAAEEAKIGHSAVEDEAQLRLILPPGVVITRTAHLYQVLIMCQVSASH